MKVKGRTIVSSYLAREIRNVVLTNKKTFLHYNSANLSIHAWETIGSICVQLTSQYELAKGINKKRYFKKDDAGINQISGFIGRNIRDGQGLNYLDSLLKILKKEADKQLEKHESKFMDWAEKMSKHHGITDDYEKMTIDNALFWKSLILTEWNK